MNSDTPALASPRPAHIGPEGEAPSAIPALAGLCLIARLHHIAAEPGHLAHQLGWPPSHQPDTDGLLLAAGQLGLKARLSRTSVERLALTPLPHESPDAYQGVHQGLGRCGP